MRRRAIAVAGPVGGAAADILLVRPWRLRWGATDEESHATLPGDDLIPSPNLTATSAITVRTTAHRVCPWIAQLGQGRGGFYSYDFWRTSLGGLLAMRLDRLGPGERDLLRCASIVGLEFEDEEIQGSEHQACEGNRGGFPEGRTFCRWPMLLANHFEGDPGDDDHQHPTTAPAVCGITGDVGYFASLSPTEPCSPPGSLRRVYRADAVLSSSSSA